MKKKIICAGHICIDITPVFPRGTRCADLGELLVPGRLIHMDGADVHTGGSVANTGLAMKMLGADVRLLGKVGDDSFGAMIRDNTPENKAGMFQGQRILSQVLIPGIIGPAIGAAVLKNAQTIIDSDGREVFLPNANIFLAALIAAVGILLALLPILKNLKKK